MTNLLEFRKKLEKLIPKIEIFVCEPSDEKISFPKCLNTYFINI